MSPFPSYPHPERFRTIEDALAFLEKPDCKLCIPVFIEVDTPKGKKVTTNPEYEDAPYEQSIVWEKETPKFRTAITR